MDSSPPYLNQLDSTQIRRLAAAFARAFFDDPSTRYFIPNDADRNAPIAAVMRILIRRGVRNGRVLATPELDAGIVWRAPEHRRSALQWLENIVWLSILFHFGWKALPRVRQCVSLLEAAHRRHMPTPHWYLQVLAVAPERQGQGVGSHMLELGLQQIDADRLPCYLETFLPRSVAYYERYGFVPAEPVQVPNGPRFWPMVRPAVS